MAALTWRDDDELFGLMREHLFTAAVGDVLDTMGLLHQFLPPGIQPLCADMVTAGRAMPVLEADYFACADPEGKAELSRKPFGLMLHALDDLSYRGKVVDFRVRIEMEGVAIAPGDIVFGDLDGVLVIPRHAEEEAIVKALEKVTQESAVRAAIVSGMSTVEAFAKFGVM